MSGYRSTFLKNFSQKVVYKTCGFLGNKIADAVTNSNDNKNVRQKHVEEIIIPPEWRQVLQKWNTIKHLSY